MQHGGNDAGCSVGGCRDHPAAGGVLLVDGERIEIDPVHHEQGVLRLSAFYALQRVKESGGAAFDLEATGQRSLRVAATVDTGAHHLPDVQ